MENDKNLIAFRRAERVGAFQDLNPGIYVAFMDGVFLAAAETQETLFKLIGKTTSEAEMAVLIRKIRDEEQIYHLRRGPRLASNQSVRKRKGVQ